MSEELQQAIAEQVLSLHPGANKTVWGSAFLDLVSGYDDPELADWVDGQLVKALGSYVNTVKVAREKRRQQERLVSRGISYAGRPMNPSLSLRREDGSRQGALWIEATPRQYVEAVLREQSVVDGRAASNSVRMQLVELLKADDDLMALPQLKDVCRELDIDPDTLGLDQLEA